MISSAASGNAAIRRSGDHWVLVYDGALCQRPVDSGAGCLALLIREPHTAISALIVERAAPTPEGRRRTVLHDARERARLRVTEVVAAEIAAIAAEHPGLAHHLRESIRIGEFCVYAPATCVEDASHLVGSLGSGV